MEWLPENWLTVVPLVGSAVGWAVAAISRAITYRREQNQKEWERINTLAKILYNKEGETGYWGQLTAVKELRTMKRKKEAVLVIAKSAREVWKDLKRPELLSELDALIRAFAR